MCTQLRRRGHITEGAQGNIASVLNGPSAKQGQVPTWHTLIMLRGRHAAMNNIRTLVNQQRQAAHSTKAPALGIRWLLSTWLLQPMTHLLTGPPVEVDRLKSVNAVVLGKSLMSMLILLWPHLVGMMAQILIPRQTTEPSHDRS